MNLPRLSRVFVLAASLGLVWAGSAVSGPGSGAASLSPSGDVAAGTVGTWTVTFTAAEVMDNGTVRVTIPAGWTAPQDGSTTSAGYLSVTTSESTGNPILSIAGQVVTVTVDTLSAGNTITITYGDAAGGSSARATAATSPGSYTFAVASDPTGSSPAAIGSSPSGNVVAAAPSYVTFAPSDTTVTAGDFAHYRLFVFDEFGNRSPVPADRSVSLFAASGQFYPYLNTTTPVTSVVIPNGQSTVRIDYRGQLAGSQQLLALPTGSPAIQSAIDNVNVIAGPLSTTISQILATSPVTANGTSQSSVTVTSRDAFGNPRQGDTVTLDVTGSAIATDPVAPTNSNGQTSGVVTNTVAQLVTVSAWINGQPIAASAPINFVAGVVSAATSTVDATSPVVANGIATSVITVTARDAQGNPVSGQSVTLAVLPAANAVLAQPGGVTNALGQVTGTLSSTVPGDRTVTATIGVTAVTDNALVNFTSGPLASFAWTEVDGSAVAGTAETVRLTAKDALGNTVTGYTGTVTVSASSAGPGTVTWTSLGPGAFAPAGSNAATYTFAASDNGTVQFTMRPTRAETITLSASDGVPAGTSGSIVVSAAAPDKVVYDTGDGQSATVNTAVGTPPRVRVTDPYNNPVGGAAVTFRVIGTVTGVGSVDVVAGGAVDSTGTTDANGYIDCDVWRLGTTAGANRLRALIASGSIPSVTFNATGTAGQEASLVLAPGSKNVTVDQTEDVTATLRDGFSNLKPNTRVDISITSVNGGTLEAYPGYTTTQLSPTARWGTTNAAGEIKVRFRSPPAAGLANTVDASTSVIGQGGVTDVVYTSSASGATNLRITFVGSSTGVAGATLVFDVEAIDGIGNRDATNTSLVNLIPDTGSTLQFSLSDWGTTVTSFSLVAGVRRIYAQETKAGDWNITVDGSGLGPDTKQVSITDTGVIDHYDVSIPASVTAGVTFNVSVTARDQYGNQVMGASNVVDLEAIDDVTTNPALSTLLVGQTTLSGGIATQAETYTKAEAIRVRASAAGKQGISGVLGVSAAAAYRIAKVSGDNINVAVGGTQVLVAQVLDAFDNPVQNEPVTFAVQGGGGNVAPPTASTNAAGNAQATLTTGPTPGNNTVKATILDENPGSLERVDYLVETVAGLIDYFTVVPAKFNPIAGEAVNLTVTAYDAQDNLVSGDSSTQIQLSSGSGTVQFGAASGTLTNGVFSTTVTDNVAEAYTVTAELLGGGLPTGTSAPVTVGHAPAYDVVKVTLDPINGLTAGTTQLLQVRVRDPYGNPIPSWPVAFAVAGSPGGATITDTSADPNDGIANTDAAGYAEATLHTSLVAGAHTVNAQIYDGNPPAQERVQFAVNTVSSSATALRITFLGATTIAAGTTSSFKVEALDAGQNLDTGNTSLVTLTPELNSDLTFSLTDFGTTITSFNLVGGTRTVYVRGTKTGNWDITASSPPLNPDTKALNVNDAGVVDHYVVTAPAGVTAGATWNVSIDARDAYGNRVLGANNLVNLAAVDDADSTVLTGVSLSAGQATLAAGVVVVNESYTRAERMRVRARDAGGKQGFSGFVQVGPGVAYSVAKVSGDGSVVAGSTQVIIAQVRDQWSNPVPGRSVAFTVQSGGGIVVPPSVSSDANGNAAATLTTGTTVGTNVARALINDGVPANLETVDFTVTTIAGAIANYQVIPLKTSLLANETTTVTARARDQYNNYVTQNNTAVVNLVAGGSAVLGAASGQLTAGAFTTTVRDDKAETFTVSANDGSFSGTSATITVSPGAPYQIVKITPDPVNGLSVGGEQALVSEVRDQWNNPVGAGINVTHLIIQTPDASSYLNDTVGDPTDGITSTAANGQATVSLFAANTAGLNRVSATILDGTPAAQERVTYDVNTVAGTIHHYDVTMGAASAVAGVPVSINIVAKDINNNLVTDNGTQVALSAQTGSGLIFADNPVTLSGGTASTTVTSNLAQTYSVLVNTVSVPATSGVGAPVTVSPAAPAGTITATATANTITANGTSVTTITSGVIADQFGNKVPAGGGVTVGATNGGQILGTQPKLIDAAGKIQFTLLSSTTPGISTVSMNTVVGTAAGSIPITFAPPVGFTCNAIPTPSIVKPGDNVRFRVVVTNTSTTAANLTTATRLSFSDGIRSFTAFLIASKTVAASDTATVVFNTTPLDGAFTAGFYQPVVTLIGSDAYGSGFNVPCTLPAQAVQVTSVEITQIVVPAQVSPGQVRDVAVSVRNNGATNLDVTNLVLSFAPGVGSYSFGAATPALPRTIPSGITQTFTIPVTIQPASGLGVDQVDAFVQATVGGSTVSDNSVAPHTIPSWEIIAAANLAYVPGTLTPMTATRGRPYGFRMSVQNTGTGVVSLDPAQTRFTFADGAFTYSAGPVQAYAIAGGATQSLTFVTTAIPAGFALGPRDVVLDARGTESGVAFSQLVSTAGSGNQLTIVTPASLAAVAGTLTPTVTSKGATATFQIQVNNSGGATVSLTPALTTLSFAGFTALLDPAGDVTLEPGASTLRFLGTLVGPAVAPSTYFPQIHAEGTENTLSFAQDFLSPTGVLIQAAPDIAISAIIPSQTTFTANQARRVQVRMVVANNGGATVSFTSASLRLFSGAVERTAQFTIASPSAFQSGGNLAPASVDTLLFQVSDAAGPMASGPLTIEGLLNVQDTATSQPISANTNTGGKGSLMVQTPAALNILAVTPSQPTVTEGMTKPTTIRVVIRNNGESAMMVDASAATLAFTPSGGWQSTPRATLASGDNLLAGMETDELVFDVSQAGSNVGDATIDATVGGIEVNSGRPVGNTSSGLGTVKVQSAGQIVVTQVTSSRSSITSGANVPWTLTVEVNNPGGSDMDLKMNGGIGIIFGGASADPPYVIPLSLQGGGTVLTAGETDQFVISVDQAGTYSLFGPQDMQVLVPGIEVNSGVERAAVGSESVVVQVAPDLAYVALAPSPVSKGTAVPFRVTVRNPVANGATLTLDPGTTRLRFGGGAFDAGLQPASPLVFAAGEQKELLFSSTVVPTGIPSGPQGDAELVLNWTENGRVGGTVEPIPVGAIEVQDAPVLSIVSLVASRETVTQGQTNPPWTVTMKIRNRGGLRVDLDLDEAKTHLLMNLLLGGADVTSEYTIIAPTALLGAGGISLAPGEEDSLLYTIQQTGNSPGTVIISGDVAGTDPNGEAVTGNTDAGGAGSFVVQAPAILAIQRITPARTTATVGQTTATYKIRMAVKNTGQADVALDLSKPNTDLSFSAPSSGWETLLSSTLAGGGVTLSGGEVDTVTFTVTTTGNPAGNVTIGGNVSGTEINTGSLKVDDTVSGGTGSILLQDPAALAIQSVNVFPASVTENTLVPWTVTVTVRNTGGAPARLTLPGGATALVQDGTVPFAPVTALQGGGNVIAPQTNGTLVFSTNSAGTFTAYGAKPISVTIEGVDGNSNVPLSASSNTASIVVQKAPILNLVSIDPATVTSEANAFFRVRVANSDPFAATAHLERATTRVYFGGAYSAFLELGTPLDIAGGDSLVVQFEDKTVVPSIAVGTYDFNADLAYSANGVPYSVPRTLAGGVTVQPAPDLSIVSINVDQQTVTAGQTVPWNVTMSLHNGGSQPITLQLDTLSTYLTFVAPGAQVDTGYEVTLPTALEFAGGTVLAPGSNDNLKFGITRTGTLTGPVTINGRVGGLVGGTVPISGNTFTGGRGTVNVQSAAAVSISAVHTSQPRVTAGQTSPWGVRVVLSNAGSASVDIMVAASGITFDGSTTGWSIDGPTALFGGGTVLAGGAVDSLLFTINATAEATGTPRIDALVPYVEINTQQLDSLRTLVSGFGSVTVEEAPSVRIATTALVAPNAPNVNTGQGYSVAVSVENTGGANASGVQVVLQSLRGSSTIQSAAPIPLVAGTQTVLLPVSATANTAGPDTLVARITSALDANSGEPAIIAASPDSVEAVNVQVPAQLAVAYVRPSQPSVTQGQSNPWNVVVAVENQGGAVIGLTPPAAGDLAFSIGGTTEIDYVVQPPTAFGSGATGWNLAGAARDSLVYRIVSTGANTGMVDVTASVEGTDRNQPARVLNDAGSTQVTVQPAAGLSILATVSAGTVNHATANRDTVNTGFNYQMRVTVQNRGEKVDSVLVELKTDDGSIIAATSSIKQSIDADSLRTFSFNVTAPPVPTPLETFTASILPGVISHNSGQPVTPQPPIDNTQVVVARTAANLVTTLAITSPPGATGGTVSTNQTFQMTGRVNNTGQALLAGPARVTLTVPAIDKPFTVAEPLVRDFLAGQAIVWNITAPDTILSAAFVCTVTTTPNDANTGQPATVSVASVIRPVSVSAGGALGAPGVSIISPAGAVDDIVSVGQNFVVRAVVTPSPDTRSVQATLTLPSGFSVVGSPVRNLGNGDGNQKQADYNIIAPANPAAAADVFVTFTGTDANSGDPVPSSADRVAVTTVARTSLSVAALVISPPEATDNTVGVSTPFNVEATVSNAAAAAGIGTQGVLTIAIPSGQNPYELLGGQTFDLPFNVGVPVQWTVTSAALPRGPDQITVTISTIPPDENSGQTALVTTRTASIAMLTEGATVAVTEVSSGLNLNDGPVPGGTTGINLLGARITYNASDANAPAAAIDTIAVTVVDKNGQPLSDAALAGTLKRLTLDLGGAQPVEVVDPSSNPVVVNVSGGGSERIIAPDASATAVVGVDLDASPRVTEFSVGIRTGGIVVRDTGSGKQLGITDGNGNALDGQITSSPLIVLSSSFEEYVHNYPNPFRAGSQSTRITYFLDQPASVSIKVYSMTGELVWEQNISSSDPLGQTGSHEALWDGRNGSGDVVRNGVYVCVLNAGSKSAKFRIAVAK